MAAADEVMVIDYLPAIFKDCGRWPLLVGVI